MSARHHPLVNLRVTRVFAITVPLALALAIMAGRAQPQATPKSPQFEVASVRLTEGFSPVMRRDPGRIDYEGVDPTTLILKAFGFPRYLVVWPDWIPSGPPRRPTWDSRYYQIVATMSPGTTTEQLQLMLQNLLRERFHFTEHRETRDFQVYEVTIAAGGIRMKESPPADLSKVGTLLAGNEDLERLARGPMLGFSGGADGIRLKGQARVSLIGEWLNQFLPHPLVDKTGLGNKYFDIDIPWSFNPRDPPPSLDSPPNKADASYVKELSGTLLKNLGLQVQLRNAPTEFLVIDHMDHVPTDN